MLTLRLVLYLYFVCQAQHAEEWQNEIYIICMMCNYYYLLTGDGKGAMLSLSQLCLCSNLYLHHDTVNLAPK